MRVDVGAVQVFVEVFGPKLIPDGWSFRSRPTLVLIHGPQGFADHTVFRQPNLPYLNLAATAQVIAVDLIGHGRSGRGNADRWNLASWAADLSAVLDRLGVERPILLGESGGGFVALQFATTFTGRLGGLILVNTSARWSLARIKEGFRRRGGERAADAAVRFWTDPTDPHGREAWQEICIPLYAPRDGWPAWEELEPPPAAAPLDLVPDNGARHLDAELFLHFNTHEAFDFDFRSGLPDIDCPVLLIGGVDDPICPIEDSDDIAAAVPRHLLSYERVVGAGHTVAASKPDEFARMVDRFIASVAGR